jgi:hypothetical protein
VTDTVGSVVEGANVPPVKHSQSPTPSLGVEFADVADVTANIPVEPELMSNLTYDVLPPASLIRSRQMGYVAVSEKGLLADFLPRSTWSVAVPLVR